ASARATTWPAKFKSRRRSRPDRGSLSQACLKHHLRDKFVEITAAEQKPRQPGSLRRLDIAGPVADHKAAGATHRPAGHQIEDHARTRLATFARIEIARDRSVGMMRTI